MQNCCVNCGDGDGKLVQVGSVPRAGGALSHERRGPGRLHGGGVLRNNHRKGNASIRKTQCKTSMSCPYKPTERAKIQKTDHTKRRGEAQEHLDSERNPGLATVENWLAVHTRAERQLVL